MKKTGLLLSLFFLQQANAQLQYPATRKVDTVDNYFGTSVADPYRWLEDDNSDETKAWVKAQNTVTQDYLSQIPYRDKVRKRLQELWNYTRYSAPFREGEWYYFTKNDGLQNQSVWYRQKGLNGQAEVFLDPNKLSEDGTVSLGSLAFSKKGKLFVYAIQRAGSDWQEAFVMDTRTKEKLTDNLNWLKFTGFSWKGEEGFYYSRYPEPQAGDKMKGRNVNQKLYYHKIGTPQSADVLVYEDTEHPQRFANGFVTEDERFLCLYTSEGTSGREIKVKDLKNGQSGFTTLIKGFTTEPSVVDNVGDKLLVQTNDGASNYKLVLVDPKNPAKEAWKEIISEKENVLQDVNTGGGFLFASYLNDASTKVYQYTYDGKLVREISLPGIGSAGGFSAKKEDKELFYSFTSYNYPPSIFRFSIPAGSTTLYRKAEVKFKPEDYEVKQVFFTSKDGTKVPMFLTYKKGLVLNGQNPTLVYGYGGFNANETPYFSVSNLFFVEQGGIYADVVLRGGSEYGENWHKAGMLQNKQNVFDDFIGAAEWLVKNNYTNPGKLAATGGSNGGLLIGAAMTQRPDLFKAVVPQVGVMDMLRFHKFTIGYAWAQEYGNSEKPEQFQYLYKYSPLHNLKKGVTYPATLVTTADHDDRVVPAHSFKYAASLQEANAGANPTLIRIETNAGHGGGMPTSKRIDLTTDIWSFVMSNLGMNFRETFPGNGKPAAKGDVKKVL
ncbi:prolyl oligopeptidase family serine peptidase [Flavisolibacter nicotianae]|uniref:prolyl oligopeptidase family serine peptidase n=1 Tax=Flavisolibacter nicotianae TaxID=2364882 RepID=UPI000EB56352|nr:prolyl oligopeptidase family serine peptidase [Flavisolibacter nicotianae]